MQGKKIIATTDAPAAIGPYSQAVRVGDTLYSSGQIPIDPKTGNLVEGGITEQTHQVLKNLSAVLAAAGVSFDHVVKTTVFLKNMGDFTAMNEVYATVFCSEGRFAARTVYSRSGCAAERLARGNRVHCQGRQLTR